MQGGLALCGRVIGVDMGFCCISTCPPAVATLISQSQASPCDEEGHHSALPL
jgi:hypothetical protein